MIFEVSTNESPYIYKILTQNSKKTSKTRVRLQEIAIPSSINQIFFPGDPCVVRTFSTQYFPKFSTLKLPLKINTRIVENNENRDMIGKTMRIVIWSINHEDRNITLSVALCLRKIVFVKSPSRAS